MPSPSPSRNRDLLHAIMPKHIASIIQSGVKSYSFCESYSLITVMFVYIMDFKISIAYFKPNQIVELVNETMNIFDDITEKFDVFNVKTKMDASYMIVSGFHDRPNVILNKVGSITSLTSLVDDEVENKINSPGLNPTEIIAYLYLSFELLRASERLINPVTRKPLIVE